MSTLRVRDQLVMTCGCAGSSLLGTSDGWVPGCGLHWCHEPMDPQPDLSERTAVCEYGGHGEWPSEAGLPFFVYRPDAPHDRYYCGCRGWD